MRITKHHSILTVICLSTGDCFLPDTVYIRLAHHPHHYFRYTATALNNILRSSLVCGHTTAPSGGMVNTPNLRRRLSGELQLDSQSIDPLPSQ
jgi:hypothetical protein